MIIRKSPLALGMVGIIPVVLLFFLGGAGENRIRTHLRQSVQNENSSEPPFLQVGEELEYKVSYSFFSIGTISFKILGTDSRNGRTIVNTRAIIESNPSLNWLKEVHIRFYGEMDDSIFSHYWVSEDSSSSGIDYHSLMFDYDRHSLYYEKGNVTVNGVKKIAALDTISVTKREQDGLSLFFFARQYARHRGEIIVPTIIENKEANAVIDFQRKIEDVDIDAVDYPVRTVFFDGRADFVGVVGMTGGFRGWFSDDDARVPIVARLNVWIGSIKVELKSWKRTGWQPPKFVETH